MQKPLAFVTFSHTMQTITIIIVSEGYIVDCSRTFLDRMCLQWDNMRVNKQT